jgi:hypothetical protein
VEAPLVRRFHAYRMVRDVILQVRETQKKLKNLLVAGCWLRCRKRLRGMAGVSQEPVDGFFINWPRFEARSSHLVRLFDDHLDKVIQANTVSGQNGQNFSTASSYMAWASHRGCPFSPGEGTERASANIARPDDCGARRAQDVTVERPGSVRGLQKTRAGMTSPAPGWRKKFLSLNYFDSM